VDEARLARLTHLVDEARANDVIAEVTEEEVVTAWTRLSRRHPARTDQPCDDPDR
jgi:hypothetical protein